MPTLTESAADRLIENRTFDELAVGESASLAHRLTRADIELFAVVSGDVNPAHLDDAYAAHSLFRHVVAHGMWTGALFSAVMGTKLPGPGSVYLGQDLRFLKPVSIDDTVTVTVTVREKRPEKHIVVFDCRAVNQTGVEVARGTAEVKAPTEKIRLSPAALPEVQLRHHDYFRTLLERCNGLPPLSAAVVHPCDAASLAGTCAAADAGLIDPVLVGPEARIRATAEAAGLDIARFRIVATPHSHAAVAAALGLVRSGEVRALIKGSVPTGELMHEVVARDSGLRTGRRMSHVYVLDVPAYPRPLLLTDAEVNIAPSFTDMRDICQNAIDLAHTLGIAEPRVALLSAIETVSDKLPATLEAAALCKMAERGQISGAVLDGPLAFDNAVSADTSRARGIQSPVAGQADVLVVRDLEAGNLLARQLSFFAGADAAGIVTGARVPIALTTHADGQRTRVASCALALLASAVGGH